jgi:phenylacetate-coenzyme A ligase PaaK-like adenylate-forming protein
MDDYVAAINAYRPKCIYGYASSVALLAAHARERGPIAQIARVARGLHHRASPSTRTSAR